MAWGRFEGEWDSWTSRHWGRGRKRFLWLSGPPQVSASTQRDGGAKRHQFTNKGPSSPTTKKTYVIELTPELQLTLTCQPPLISFVNSPRCLPNWGPVTCGLSVYQGKCLDSPKKRHFPLASFCDLFTHSSTKNHHWNHHTLKNPTTSNCLIINKCIDGVLTYWFQDTNSLEKLNVLHEVKLLPSLHLCVLEETSCLSMFGDVSESLWWDRGLSCAPCRSAGWSSCDPCC